MGCFGVPLSSHPSFRYLSCNDKKSKPILSYCSWNMCRLLLYYCWWTIFFLPPIHRNSEVNMGVFEIVYPWPFSWMCVILYLQFPVYSRAVFDRITWFISSRGGRLWGKSVSRWIEENQLWKHIILGTQIENYIEENLSFYCVDNSCRFSSWIFLPLTRENANKEHIMLWNRIHIINCDEVLIVVGCAELIPSSFLPVHHWNTNPYKYVGEFLIRQTWLHECGQAVDHFVSFFLYLKTHVVIILSTRKNVRLRSNLELRLMCNEFKTRAANREKETEKWKSKVNNARWWRSWSEFQ